MSLIWTLESAARWDAGKKRIVGGADKGIFDIDAVAEGELVPGEWWRVQSAGALVGYGWMDVVWGEGEILLAVDANARGQGVGGFIIERLADEAGARGLRVVYNKVRASHPDAEAVTKWLLARGFEADADSERLFRRT
jgi:GNAT superfamily N-acetyltransferase